MAVAKPTNCKEAIRRWEEDNRQEASTAKEVILNFQWPPVEKMDNTLATLANCEKLSLSTNMIEKIAGAYISYLLCFLLEILLMGVKRFRVTFIISARLNSIASELAAICDARDLNYVATMAVISFLKSDTELGGLVAFKVSSCVDLLPVGCDEEIVLTNVGTVGIGTLKNLKILSLGRNLIKGFSGLEPLGDTLEELWISYNLIEKMKGINAMKNLRVLYMSNNLVREWNEFGRLQELGNLQDLVFVGNPLYESVEMEQWRPDVARRLSTLEKLDANMNRAGDPTALKIPQLKELLRVRELPIMGKKAELIARLDEADPSRSWAVGAVAMENNVHEPEEEDSETDEDPRERATLRPELELCRRERAVAERELELTEPSNNEDSTRNTKIQPPIAKKRVSWFLPPPTDLLEVPQSTMVFAEPDESGITIENVSNEQEDKTSRKTLDSERVSLELRDPSLKARVSSLDDSSPEARTSSRELHMILALKTESLWLSFVASKTRALYNTISHSQAVSKIRKS
ncbi:Dynein light chain 1, axonemal [Dufourea novaeangliae]|uniref:Dynein light chain 1, axonemal n=1 Tax=Dufourea novaeangliae TaxID=178035 RepID=A0A154PSS6_DUFNO|nr:Dynein light chain 1, axonemal [Dufourea novaeangliae]